MSINIIITEDNVQVIPQYLRFSKAVVDSPDLPLNISRERLQNNRVVEQIGKSLTKRAVSEVGKKAKDNLEEYTKFWGQIWCGVKRKSLRSYAN